jgi:hypothetical protein
MRILCLVLVTFALAAPCLAQGTSGTLPDPISSRDLSRYSDRLGLSDEQRLAIEAFHDDYRDGFRRLRETDIEKFLETTESLNFGWRLLENREAVLDSVKEIERIVGRIRNLDEQLFNQVQTILTEAQVEKLPRVRQMRERARYNSGLVRFTRIVNPSSRVDVTELLLESGADPAALAEVDPIIAQYESSLTASNRKLFDTTLGLAETLFKKLDEMGFSGDAMRDRRRRAQMFGSLGMIWAELTKEITARTLKMSELNRRVVKDLQVALPPAPARRLHDAFYSTGYPESGAGDNPARRKLEKALDMDDLTATQREQIVALQESFDLSVDHLTHEAADLLDKSREQPLSFFGDIGGVRAELESSLAALSERRARENESANDTLESMLGPDLAGRLSRRIAAADEGDGRVLADGTPRAPEQRDRERSRSNRWGMPDPIDPNEDPFLPRAISRTDVRLYAEVLGFDDAIRPIVDSFHDDYQAAFAAVESTELSNVREAQERLWKMDDAGRMIPPDGASIAHVYRLRRQAVAAVATVDGTLMDGDDAATIERLRLTRQRDVYRQGIRAGRVGGGRSSWQRNESEESSVDMSVVVRELDPPVDDTAQVQQELLRYEQEAMRIFETGWEATIKFREAMDKMSAEGGGRGWRGWRTLMENEGAALREARDRVTNLNRATLRALEAAVPTSSQTDLRHVYYRHAYPAIYDDAQATTPALTSALGLDDLSAHQRSSLTDLNTEYRAAYDDLSWSMVEVMVRDIDDEGTGSREQERWQARAQRERDLDRLRAERDDLNHKPLIRLRGLLGDLQSDRIGLDSHLERSLERDSD